MTLQIHRAVRAERLAAELGDILVHPLSDPFAVEVVAVPTQGVERWLAQSLSHRLGTSDQGRDGICAGVDFPSPGRLTDAAVAAASGLDVHADPWLPRRAVWPLLSVLDRAHGEPWAALLWSYLGDRPAVGAASPTGSADPGPGTADDPQAVEPVAQPQVDLVRRGRRWSTAQHLVELFAHYARNRPAMVLAWREGRDVDGSGRPLTPDYAWQAELWRRLRAELDTPDPAERTTDAVARLTAEPGLTPLPARLSLFGATRLSAQHRAVLSALAVHRDVHLWLPHPSPALWRRIADQVPPGTAIGPRALDLTVEVPRHPLLGYLGRDVRELQQTLSSGGPVLDVQPPEATDVPPAGQTGTGQNPNDQTSSDRTPGDQIPRTLLAQLQQDLAADRPAGPLATLPLLDPDDRSVTLHASHGPDRQVEVLRELLVGLLADDPTLEPRDIVVMCPDIERFAPLISASFGLQTAGQPPEPGGAPLDQADEHPGHRLRVRLADRALRQVNPLLAALSRVLDLAGSRMEASTLLDLCAFAPVAQKFGFSEDDLERLQDLVTRAGVRWGLDAEHRQAFGMGSFAQNTWAAGLDRLLLGVAMDESEQEFIGTALPLDDVDSSDVELVGRLAELVERLRSLTLAYGSARSLGSWVELCRQTIELVAAPAPSDGWQLSHAYGELGSLAQSAGEDPTAELSLSELQALLGETFRGRATRANFRTGTLTMCTMMPMRSVPHRVICLLGVDDGVFPRSSSRDGDDILAAEPWVGDRDPRSEDRQLLLDAVMAATDHLLVIYAGADPRTRAPRPPAVPVGALMDALDATARTDDGRRVRDHVVTVHPLQPFDPANFTSESPVATAGHPGGGAFSFDRQSWRGALAAGRPRAAVPSTFATDRLPAPVLPEVVALVDLVRFFQHPARALLRSRAGLQAARDDAEPDDEIPVRLDGLQAWSVGDRMLRAHLEGLEIPRLSAAEWRRGVLPPRQLGGATLGLVVERVAEIAEVSRPYLVEAPSGVDVLAPAGAHTVAGTLTVRGDLLVAVGYSWVGAKQRLQAWIELLALTASRPERSWQAVTVGRGRPSVLGPVPGPWAAMVLTDLVDLYRTGLSEPLPLGVKTAAEYARIRSENKSVTVLKEKLDKTWAEDRDPTYERFFGRGVTLDTVLAVPSVPAEERGKLAEPSRFGTLARRIWQPLLGSEPQQ